MTATIQWDAPALSELFTSPIGPVGLELERVALLVEDAARSLVSRPGTGRVYTHGGVAHQAAAPGEPFSAETGGSLRDSIGHALIAGPRGLAARVGTDMLDGLLQEVGTRRMPAHPWLRPALASVMGKSPAAIHRFGKQALTRQRRQKRAARAIGRALTAGPRQRRREALAARRIGRALRGLG